TAELPERSARMEAVRTRLLERGVEARTACFTSSDPGADLVRLAAEQEAELLVLGVPLAQPALDKLMDAAPCDVALAPRPELAFRPDAPVLLPFRRGKEQWAAPELGGWLARAYGVPLRLLGADAREGRREA